MEDCVTETEKKLVFPWNKKDEADGGVEERESGIIKQLVSGEDEEKKSSGSEGGGKEEEKEKEKEKEGGFLNHIISILVSDEGKSEVEDDGIIKNLISNVFNQNHQGGEEERERVVERNNGKGKPEDEGGGGGRSIIHNIVSRLPTPLADDAAPATDEASILIHSIIHD